jgi:hypothetical protein
VPHLRRSVHVCFVSPGPAWAEVWCRPCGPLLRTLLSHVYSSVNFFKATQLPERTIECCAAPTALGCACFVSQAFRPGLKFGAGPPGLYCGHCFSMFIPALTPSKATQLPERTIECCAAPTALATRVLVSQAFRPGLKFGAGPPGLDCGHCFSMFRGSFRPTMGTLSVCCAVDASTVHLYFGWVNAETSMERTVILAQASHQHGL